MGAATIATLAVLLMAVLLFGTAVAARHRAQSVADLSALAGASAALLEGRSGCEVARELAADQEGALRVSACIQDGDDVQVTVSMTVRLGRFGIRDATASARAGPIESVE